MKADYVDIGFRTVKTFSGLARRPLYLQTYTTHKKGSDAPVQATGAPFTDGVNLHVKPPRVRTGAAGLRYYTKIEMLLSRVLFETNHHAREAFILQYSADIEVAFEKMAPHLAQDSDIKLNAIKALQAIIEILDIQRTLSVWGILYPGSGERIYEYYRDQIKTNVPQDAIGTLFRVFAGHPLNATSIFIGPATGVLRKVRGCGFSGVLGLSKWYLGHCIDALLQDQDPSTSGNGSVQDHLSDPASGFSQNKDGQAVNDTRPWDTKPKGESSSGADSPGDGDAGGSPDDAGASDGGDPDGSGGQQGGDQEGSGGSTGASGDTSAPSPFDQYGAPGGGSAQDRLSAMKSVLDDVGQSPVLSKALKSTMRAGSFSSERARSFQSYQRHVGAQAAKLDVRDMGMLNTILASSKERTKKIVQKIRTHDQSNIQSRDDWVTRGSSSRICFSNVSQALLEEQTKRILLTPSERRQARKMRAQFLKLIGRARSSLRYEGASVCVPALLERRITRSSQPVFNVTEIKGQGFEALTLLDLSVSMSGSKLKCVERVQAIMAKALNFPFVALRTWGFASVEAGTTSLVRLPSHYDRELQPFCGGRTPTPFALQTAVRDMMMRRSARHIFLLTDGVPVYRSRRGHAYSQDLLLKLTRGAVNLARSRGVNLTTLLIGEALGGEDGRTVYEMKAESMNKTFGAKGWFFVNPRTLDKDFMRIIQRAFTRYLQSL